MTTLLTLSCDTNHRKVEFGCQILSGGCGSISLVDDIGTDFDTALDSLILIRESFIGDDYIIEEVDMEVSCNVDHRVFKGIIFRSPDDGIMLLSLSDVLDSEGNYYFINWCPD